MSEFSLWITWVICNNSPKYRNGFVLNAEVLTNQRNIARRYHGKPGEERRGRVSQLSLSLVLTDLKHHLYRKLYLCKDSDEAQLCALALLPYQVDFVKASVVRLKELIRLMIHWLQTSFASPTEENKYVTSTWVPSSLWIFMFLFSALSGPTSFFGRQSQYV